MEEERQVADSTHCDSGGRQALPCVTRVLVGAGWQSLTKEEEPHPDLEGHSPVTEEKTVQKQGQSSTLPRPPARAAAR